MKLQNVILKIKKTTLIRILAFPVINFIRISRLLFYRYSADSKNVKALKDTHKNERCFIIGNGPSLTSEDLDKIENEYCFAANRIYQMFDKTKWRPQCYLCVDSFVLNDVKDKICNLDIPHIMVHMEGKKLHLRNNKRSIIYINNYYLFMVNRHKLIKNIEFSSQLEKYFIAGETVTYNAIQLAAYMGFKEIYLLGIDHNYSKKMDSKGNLVIDNSIKDYFGDLPSNDYSIQNIETSTAAYEAAREYCENNNIIIKNLTRGGKLEVFERSDLETVLLKEEE